MLLTFTFGAMLPALAIAGKIYIKNCCPDSIYLYSVASKASAEHLLSTGDNYDEDYRYDPKTGVVIKVFSSPRGLTGPFPQTNVAYSLSSVDSQTFWYDLSDVFGDPFVGKKITAVPSDPSCSAIVWNNGVKPSDATTQACSSKSDLVVTFCAS